MRKSAEAMSVAPIGLVPSKRPEPPGDLTSEEAKKEWNRIVNSMPPDWFTPEMWGMLATMCNAAVELKKVSACMVHEDPGSKEYANYARLFSMLASTVSRISSKLKLTAQSRHNMNRAHKATEDAIK